MRLRLTGPGPPESWPACLCGPGCNGLLTAWASRGEGSQVFPRHKNTQIKESYGKESPTDNNNFIMRR